MNKIPTRTTTFDLIFITLIFIGGGILFSGILGGAALKITGAIESAYVTTCIVIIVDFLLYLRVIKEEYSKKKEWDKWKKRNNH